MNGKFHISVFVMLAAVFLFSCALDFKIGKRDSWPEQDAPGEAADGLDVDVGEEIIIPPGCGNGEVDSGEECDDGNDSNNDACLNICRNAYCGDGYLWEGVEECDSHDPVSCTMSCGITGEGSCSGTCTLPPASECSPLPGECCENADCIDVGECRQGGACDGNVCDYIPVDDMTPCPGGICCGGECRAGADCCTNEDCPMGCKGTALDCRVFDGITCATQTGCFWSGGPEVCYGSGFSCGGFTDNETCSACGCFWSSYGGCLGPGAICGYVSFDNCSTCGCNWGFPSCSGSLDCEMFSTREGCESCGCLWDYDECYGFNPCSNIMDGAFCISCGCGVTPLQCGGTHLPCNLYHRHADCATELDCYWSVCDNYNCT